MRKLKASSNPPHGKPNAKTGLNFAVQGFQLLLHAQGGVHGQRGVARHIKGAFQKAMSASPINLSSVPLLLRTMAVMGVK